MVSKLTLGDQGLDFGSGPGPTLSIMFREAGYPMEIYDYFYAPNTDVLNNQYDFITATEVIEHLRHPIQTLNLLWKILKPGGVLGIMTETVPDHKLFSDAARLEEEVFTVPVPILNGAIPGFPFRSTPALRFV